MGQSLNNIKRRINTINSTRKITRSMKLVSNVKCRRFMVEEYKQREKMRRSIIVVRDLPAGHILEHSDLYAKRPGTGIAPNRINDLVGKRLVCSVEADTLLSEDDFQ